jgi:signal peptidase I
MENKQKAVSLKGTWKQALVTFFSPLLLFLIVRWAVIEPFVIPSESMVPNLLIHDHILVFKSSFGLKLPFSDKWLASWGQPQSGDVVVFKYPINPNLYYIKRVIGRPGDHLKITNGRLERNNEIATYTEQITKNLFIENLNGRKHTVRFLSSLDGDTEEQIIDVPDDKYFVMGDNRDASSDSRVWGFVPKKNLIGKTWIIWLSCDETLTDVEFLCDPLKLRWDRIFKKVEAEL